MAYDRPELQKSSMVSTPRLPRVQGPWRAQGWSRVPAADRSRASSRAAGSLDFYPQTEKGVPVAPPLAEQGKRPAAGRAGETRGNTCSCGWQRKVAHGPQLPSPRSDFPIGWVPPCRDPGAEQPPALYQILPSRHSRLCFLPMHRASEPGGAWRPPGPSPSFYREENGSIEEKGFAQGHPESGGRAEPGPLSEKMLHTASPHTFLDHAPSPWPHLSVNKYLLNTCYLPDNIRDLEETAVDKTNQTPTQVELTFSLNPSTYLLHLRSRHMLSCCNPEGLVRKNHSAHVHVVQARGPFPWRKWSISWKRPKREK